MCDLSVDFVVGCESRNRNGEILFGLRCVRALTQITSEALGKLDIFSNREVDGCNRGKLLKAYKSIIKRDTDLLENASRNQDWDGVVQTLPPSLEDTSSFQFIYAAKKDQAERRLKTQMRRYGTGVFAKELSTGNVNGETSIRGGSVRLLFGIAVCPRLKRNLDPFFLPK